MNIVYVHLVGFSVSLFCSNQLCKEFRYVCMLFWARVILLLVEVGVRSSAYPVRETPGGVAGGSDRYKLKRAGERTPPCGTPVLMFFFEDLHWLYTT